MKKYDETNGVLVPTRITATLVERFDIAEAKSIACSSGFTVHVQEPETKPPPFKRMRCEVAVKRLTCVKACAFPVPSGTVQPEQGTEISLQLLGIVGEPKADLMALCKLPLSTSGLLSEIPTSGLEESFPR